MLSTIYFERQEHGSMLCAQHSLNNLLQDGIYTPQDLAHNAQVLDDLESAQLNGRRGDSTNYDDSGFFSIGGRFPTAPLRRIVADSSEK